MGVIERNVTAAQGERGIVSLAAGTYRIGQRHSTILDGLDPILDVAIDLLELLWCQ